MPQSDRLLFVLAAALSAALAGPAMARNVTADISQIAALLKSKGETLEIKSAADDPYIRVTGEGYDYSIFAYGCDDKDANCKSVQFYAAFNPKVSPELQAMNDYARDNRWGRIFLDKEGDPAIEFDVDLEKGGMSEALFLDNVAYWEAIIDKYGDFVFGPNGQNNNTE
jgi:Putative bacterial sensory transduction regulator